MLRKKLIIDEEFKNLIPPLTKDEYSQLEKNIINEGCRDSLVIWNDIIVDGHNRYQICTKNIIPFSTKEMDFEKREEAMQWIIRNQFGRRNLSAYERAKLALKLEPVIQEKAKENQMSTLKQNTSTVNQKSDKRITTDKELAQIAGVSHDTIHKVKIIEDKGSEELKEQLKNKVISINKAYSEIRKKDGTKICNICGKEKPIGEFYAHHSHCKICERARKSVGLSTKKAKELNQKFPDEKIQAIYDEMKNPLPCEGEHEKDECNSIITEFKELLNNFNNGINKFTFMEQYFKDAKEVKLLIEVNIKNLRKIINFIKE